VTTISAGTTILSGNNSAATGGLVVGGATSTADKPVLRLNSVNAISSSSSISGANSSDRTGTLDFAAGTSYTLNNYNGGNMIFTNSFGQASVVTFTNAESLLTSSAGSSGGRSLQNNSSNLKIVFDGSLDIGSSVTDTVNTIGGAGDFVVKGNIFSTTAGSVRGLSKTGTGLLEMRGDNNSYNGNTTIFNGTISVTNGAVLTGTTVRVAPTSGNSGTLLVNGTAGAVVVSARGILAGGGTVGNVTLETGSFLKPGNSPGLLTASSSTWAAGSTYNWEIDNATGTAGTNWDLFSVTGALDLAALSSGAQMNLVLESLSIANFSTSAEYSWVIAQAASFIGTGLENGTDVTSLFNINTAAFNGGAASNLPNGGFQVVTGTAGSLRTLTLMAVPEPSTGSMLGLGLAGLVVTRLLRRKNS
jgi:autotransporter-associated beta strand protein